MNNLNIHGRHPKDLPDKETIDDILLELHDTNKFDIKWINLDNMSWRVNNKLFHNWLEKGEVITCEMDSTFPTFNPSEDGFDSIPMSYATVKQTRYDILRHPIRIEVRLKEEVPAKDGRAWINFMTQSGKIIDEVKETYLRLKDYLGPDIIQDQLLYVSFNIDFMLSSCKEIK